MIDEKRLSMSNCEAMTASSRIEQQVAASQVPLSQEQDTSVPLFTVLVDSPLQSKVSPVAGASQQVAASQVPQSPEQDTPMPLFTVCSRTDRCSRRHQNSWRFTTGGSIEGATVCRARHINARVHCISGPIVTIKGITSKWCIAQVAAAA